ncbi:MAG: hypothetical protein L6R42_007491 [Xanthoria sp. 1 TBL-2021]|nr:MAG: hypothetical protein L6R42_007491 [Xanthoria sp. 1 TBL-2021]
MPLFSRKSPSVTSTPVSPSTEENDTAQLAQDTDGMQRFTATGRPMPSYNPSALGNMPSSFVGQAPQFLPQKFTDDSVLMNPVPMSAFEDPSSAPNGDDDTVGEQPQQERQQQQQQRRSSSFMNKLEGGEKKGGKKEEFKMVKMTRGEYLMYWAKDEEGRGGRGEAVEREGEL